MNSSNKLSNSLKLSPLLGGGLVYAWLASGFYFSSDDYGRSTVSIALLLISSAFVVINSKRINAKGLMLLFSLLFPFLVVLMSSLILQGSSGLGFERFLSFFIPIFYLSIIGSIMIKKFGSDRFLQFFLVVCGAVLFLTLIYKLNFGFFDRTIRYFLNGPIVFGWLMGAAAIIAITSCVRRRFLWFSVFFLATFWSFSKGPIVALLSVLVLHGLFVHRKPFATSVCCICFVAIFFVLKGLDIPAINRMALVVEKGSDILEIGSVAARYEMAKLSSMVFFGDPFFGVGLGNWSLYVNWGGATYPHNIIMEILSELGLIGLLTISAFILPAFLFGEYRPALIFIFLFICAQFSGDLGYFRIPVFFLMFFYLREGRLKNYAK